MPSTSTRRAAFTAPRATTVRRLGLAFGLATTISTTVIAAAPRTAKQTPGTTTAAPSATITLIADGQTRTVKTSATTLADLLREQNLHLGATDRASQPLTSLLKDQQTITITRVRSAVITERTPIAFGIRQKYTGTLPVGKKAVVTPGVAGVKETRYRAHYKDDKLTEKLALGSRVVSQPRPQVEIVGTRGMTLASRGYFGGRRVIEMIATGYGPGGNGRWGMQTSTGLRPTHGVVAVDPRFIPLGTRLYVEGYGYAVAGDTGSAIKGNRIDLCHDTNAAAAAVGRRKVRVLILD